MDPRDLIKKLWSSIVDDRAVTAIRSRLMPDRQREPKRETVRDTVQRLQSNVPVFQPGELDDLSGAIESLRKSAERTSQQSEPDLSQQSSEAPDTSSSADRVAETMRGISEDVQRQADGFVRWVASVSARLDDPPQPATPDTQPPPPRQPQPATERSQPTVEPPPQTAPPEAPEVTVTPPDVTVQTPDVSAGADSATKPPDVNAPDVNVTPPNVQVDVSTQPRPDQSEKSQPAETKPKPVDLGEVPVNPVTIVPPQNLFEQVIETLMAFAARVAGIKIPENLRPTQAVLQAIGFRDPDAPLDTVTSSLQLTPRAIRGGLQKAKESRDRNIQSTRPPSPRAARPRRGRPRWLRLRPGRRPPNPSGGGGFFGRMRGVFGMGPPAGGGGGAAAAGASGASGAAAGGGLALMTGVIAVGAFVAVLGAAVAGLNRLSRASWAVTNSVAKWNGELLSAQLQLQVGDLHREMRMAQALGESGSEYLKSKDRLNEALHPWEERMNTLGNQFGTLVNNIAASILEGAKKVGEDPVWGDIIKQLLPGGPAIWDRLFPNGNDQNVGKDPMMQDQLAFHNFMIGAEAKPPIPPVPPPGAAP